MRLRNEAAAPLQRGPIDPWLLLAAVLLLLVGEVMVFNTTYFYAFERFGQPFRFVWKHQLALLLGVSGLLIAATLPSATYRRLAYPALLAAFFGLLVVLIPGVTHGSVRRWIALGPLNFQPSELAKGAVALYLAHSMARKADRIAHFFYGLLPYLLVVGCAAVLIAIEPDLGGAAVLSLMLLAFLFVSGARKWHLGALTACGVVLLVVGIVIAPYRMQRILGFLHVEENKLTIGYQLNQSIIAVGAGGLTGVGLGESRQKMLFLPEAHTDFIFAVIGEETGLLGAGVVLFLFALLGARGLRVAARHPQPFGSLLAFGCTFLLVGQAVLNMAVVLGLLPTKGLPLPFISYGGSALIMAMVYTGVLLSLSRETWRENQVYA
ncbi:MAG TPA: putative lipid II flippase FtsW [Methylomirabilota bacterium]|jgi:cell division protein FtsW|nr:putative lipid II flippase FtsW [Methylomirabilota bacterium]